MSAHPRSRVPDERAFRLHPGHPMDRADRPEVVVLSTGRAVSLYVGTPRGACLGTLDAEESVELAKEILMRRDRPTPAFTPFGIADWDGPRIQRPRGRGRGT